MDEHRRCRIIVQCALVVVKVTYRGVHSVYVVICHHEDICLGPTFDGTVQWSYVDENKSKWQAMLGRTKVDKFHSAINNTSTTFKFILTFISRSFLKLLKYSS